MTYILWVILLRVDGEPAHDWNRAKKDAPWGRGALCPGEELVSVSIAVEREDRV